MKKTIFIMMAISILLLTACSKYAIHNPEENMETGQDDEKVVDIAIGGDSQVDTVIENDTQEDIAIVEDIQEDIVIEEDTEEDIVIEEDTAPEEEPEDETETEDDTPQDQDTEEVNEDTEYLKIDSVEQKTEFRELIPMCNYYMKSEKGSPFDLNVKGSEFVFELVDYKFDDAEYSYKLYNLDKSDSWNIDDWARFNINDYKIVEFPARTAVDVEFENGQMLTLAFLEGYNEQVYLCIDSKEEYDIDFCEKLKGDEKDSCFENLGLLYGEEYCDKIDDPDMMTLCIYGTEDELS